MFLLKKIRLKKIRLTLRGYRIAKERHGVLFMHHLRNALVGKKYMCSDMGRGILNRLGLRPVDYECALQQTFSLRLYDSQLTSEIYSSIASDSGVSHPLPFHYQEALKEYGINVNEFRSSQLWYIHLLKSFLSGIKLIISFSLESLGNIFSKERDHQQKNYSNRGTQKVFFEGLNASQIPRKNECGDNYDIFSWFDQFVKDENKLGEYLHTVSSDDFVTSLGSAINTQKHFFNGFLSISEIICFWKECAILSLVVIRNAIKGDSSGLILFKDIVLCSIFANTKSRDQLPEIYMFQSSWIYRPCWTYLAEKSGIEIIFYWYSTNSEGIKIQEQYRGVDFDWKYLSWSKYFVWNDYQKRFLERGLVEFPPPNNISYQIKEVGPIWFHGSVNKPNKLPVRAACVFDVSPLRKSGFIKLSANSEYLLTKNVILFLNDVINVLKEQNINILLKNKRKNLHPEVDKNYLSYIKNMNDLGMVHLIDSETSPQSLIGQAKISISFPYTSTALISKADNTPSCYYDPTGEIHKDDNGAHGIEIINSIDELRNWVASNIRED